jgi:hypothetical protein
MRICLLFGGAGGTITFLHLDSDVTTGTLSEKHLNQRTFKLKEGTRGPQSMEVTMENTSEKVLFYFQRAGVAPHKGEDSE